MIYCNNQLKKYITPLLRLVRGALSNHLLMSMSEAFSVRFYTLIKLCHTKLLSDQAWSLVPKLNLLQRSRIRHCSPKAITVGCTQPVMGHQGCCADSSWETTDSCACCFWLSTPNSLARLSLNSQSCFHPISLPSILHLE